jgi:hypothetical protein
MQPPGSPNVTIVAYPLDAEVLSGNGSLGLSPVRLALGAGEAAQITVQRDGYLPKTLTVDSGQPRVEVVLLKSAPPPQDTALAPRAREIGAAPSASSTGGAAPAKCKPGEIVLYGKCEKI